MSERDTNNRDIIDAGSKRSPASSGHKEPNPNGLIGPTPEAASLGVCVMPNRYVAWSLSLTDAKSRDDLFGWLAERVHRWGDWGELAYCKGADALTSHLLSVIVGSGGLSR